MTILSSDLETHRLAETMGDDRAGACALRSDGAYRTDVLRLVRGTPNADELAALVAALLLTRRAHEERQERRLAAPQAAQQHRPTWPRGGYPAPGSWAAGS